MKKLSTVFAVLLALSVIATALILAKGEPLVGAVKEFYLYVFLLAAAVFATLAALLREAEETEEDGIIADTTTTGRVYGNNRVNRFVEFAHAKYDDVHYAVLEGSTVKRVADADCIHYTLLTGNRIKIYF